MKHELWALLGRPVQLPKWKVGKFQRPDCTLRFEGHNIVVEYDGHFFHSAVDGALDRDRRKTTALETAGYRVFRVREGKLPKVTDNDVCVRRNASTHAIACATLHKIQEVLGVEIPRLGEYAAGGVCWLADEAEEEIAFRKAAQVERRTAA